MEDNKALIIATILASIGLVFVAGGLYISSRTVPQSRPLQGGVLSEQSYGSASSTVFTIGDDLTTTVLGARGDRGYALFCNVGLNRAYLVLSSASATATTSADVLIAPGECYEIDADNRYTGEVQAIQETASSTNTLIVTEMISQ